MDALLQRGLWDLWYQAARGTIGSIDSGIKPAVLSRTPFSLWQDGRNVRFRNDGVVSGYSSIAPFDSEETSPVRGVSQLLLPAGQQFFFGTPTKLKRWNAVAVEDLSQLSGYNGPLNETVIVPASKWSMEPWGTWMIASNGTDPVQVSKSGALFAALANTTFTWAKIIKKVGPYIIALNTSNGETMVEWSSDDNPELWTPLAENTAGNIFIRDLDSSIKDAQMIGGDLMIYGQSAAHRMQYIGGSLVFGIKKALDGIGSLAIGSTVSVGRQNFGLSFTGFWITDGVQFAFIDDPDVRDWFKNRVNWDQKSKICGYHNEAATRVEWFYPKAGLNAEPSEGLAYDYQRKHWTPLDYGYSAVQERRVFNWPLVGKPDGTVAFDNYGDNETPYVVTKPLDLGDARQFKYIDYMNFMTSGDDFQVEVGTQNNLEEAIVWSDPYTISQSDQVIPMRLSARFFTLKFSGPGPWQLGNFTFYGRMTGGPIL